MKRLLLLAALLASPAYAQTQAWNTNVIAWDASSGCIPADFTNCPVAGYLVERSQSSTGVFTQIGTTAANVTTFTHTALAGNNCYRVIANAAPPLLPSPPSPIACKVNVAPPVSPAPPTNLRFVTVAAVTHSLADWTPVVSILQPTTSTPRLHAGADRGQVPTGRTTQGPPLFTYRGKQHCKVEVSTKEVFIAGTSLTNLAAPCGA